MNVFNLEKEKLEKIGKTAKKGCKYLFYGLVTVISCMNASDVLELMREDKDATYSDAVDAITHSNILDSYKRDILGMIKPNKDSELYKAVIKIARSNMLDSYKRDTIRNIIEENN